MKIYLTGATGYLGRPLARRLLAAGHELRCLVRSGSDAADLAQAGAVLCPGDLGDRASLAAGMGGAELVIHAAALVDQGATLESLRRVNVEGSRNVAAAAHEQGPVRLVLFSSVARFGGSPDDGSPADEGAAVRRPHPTPYALTKHEGEAEVRVWQRRGLPLDVLYPSLVYGPPGKPKGANAFLAGLARGGYPVLVAPDRVSSWVHVDDVVEATLAVAESARPGRDYLLAGDAATIRELAATVCRIAGRRPPRLALLLPLAKLAAAVSAPLFRLAGRRPPADPRQLQTLERHWHFDDSRARRELGWRPRSLEEGLAETVPYLLDR